MTVTAPGMAPAALLLTADGEVSMLQLEPGRRDRIRLLLAADRLQQVNVPGLELLVFLDSDGAHHHKRFNVLATLLLFPEHQLGIRGHALVYGLDRHGLPTSVSPALLTAFDSDLTS